MERSGWENFISGPALGKIKCLDSETAFVTVLKGWGRGRAGGFCVA